MTRERLPCPKCEYTVDRSYNGMESIRRRRAGNFEEVSWWLVAQRARIMEEGELLVSWRVALRFCNGCEMVQSETTRFSIARSPSHENLVFIEPFFAWQQRALPWVSSFVWVNETQNHLPNVGSINPQFIAPRSFSCFGTSNCKVKDRTSEALTTAVEHVCVIGAFNNVLAIWGAFAWYDHPATCSGIHV